MPTTRKRKKRNAARFTLNDSVIRAIGAGDHSEARRLLGVRPWEWGSGPLFLPTDDPAFTELIAEIRKMGVGDAIE